MEITKGKVNSDFWRSKRVFLTGHTGFKGSWMSIWLESMGAVVKGYSLEPNTKPNLFHKANIAKIMKSEIGDIRNLSQLSKSILDFNPDILIHMAAQPLVRNSYLDPVNTYTTNVIGTVNVLEASRKCNKLKSIISVTTDKCYENKEWDKGYKESDPMGGHDPYSSSKGCAELVTSAYRRSFFNLEESASLASARAGNVIGGGDWSNDRLIPDVLNAFEKSEPVIIRNPLSTRPWQHVLEPISGYLVLAQNLYNHGDEFSGGWNFGPKEEGCKPVNWILDQMISHWGGEASWNLDKNNNPHEAGFLKLDCTKSYNQLNWESKLDLIEALKLTIDWHKNYLLEKDCYDLCLNQIKQYTSLFPNEKINA
jgi:CDP-glucose 4,6-dehydratase